MEKLLLACLPVVRSEFFLILESVRYTLNLFWLAKLSKHLRYLRHCIETQHSSDLMLKIDQSKTCPGFSFSIHCVQSREPAADRDGWY